MKVLRNLVAVLACLLLGGGYFASQIASMTGTASLFAFRMDQAPVRVLALLLLVGAVGLSFAPDPEAS